MNGPAATPTPGSLPPSGPGSSRPPISDWMRWNDVALTTLPQHTALRVEVSVTHHGPDRSSDANPLDANPLD